MSIAPYCQGCQRQVPAKYCEFTQGIGMLVIRTSRGVKGNLCKTCSSKYFWEMTGLTLLTGWWGMISFIMNIVYIVSNISYFIGSRSLPDAGTQAFPVQLSGPAPVERPQPAQSETNPALEALRKDVTLRLRGGQTPQQIAQFIAPRTGLSIPQAQELVLAIKNGTA